MSCARVSITLGIVIMHRGNLPDGHGTDGPQARLTFRKPVGCKLEACSALALYERELKRHRAREARLAKSLLRDIELLHQKDALLLQKDLLVKEVEHRLLNGLQLVRSVLTMQSRSTENLETALQLNEAATRISSLSRVQETLHAMDTLESIEFKHYLAGLCADIAGMVPSVTLDRSFCIEGDQILLPRKVATALALIASELITNSMKYGAGKITVQLKVMPKGDVLFSVQDEGPGFPALFDLATSKGLGMKIIGALVKQIDGDLVFGPGDAGRGAWFSVRFRLQE